MTETCQNCKFRYGESDKWANRSQCRRYPPTNKPHSHGGDLSVWPTVSLYEWCGEHQPVPEPQPAER